jgi:hypothetical protein
MEWVGGSQLRVCRSDALSEGSAAGCPSLYTAGRRSWLGWSAPNHSDRGCQGTRTYAPGISMGALADFRAFRVGGTAGRQISLIIVAMRGSEGQTRLVADGVSRRWNRVVGRGCACACLAARSGPSHGSCVRMAAVALLRVLLSYGAPRGQVELACIGTIAA